MKKLLLLSAIVLGAVTVSRAGVRFDIGIPIPVPPLVVAPRAYVQPAPTYIDPAPPVYAPAPPVVVTPPVVVGPPVFDFRFGHEPYWRHFRNEFSYDYGRDYHRDFDRGYHRDFDRGYHRDYGHHDYDRGYNHRR